MWALLAALAWADPGAEVVLVLDTSCSMAVGSTGGGKSYPANDPERAAVLGALVVEGLVRGSNDRLTVVGFQEKPASAPPAVSSAAEIRALPYTNDTLFRRPLEEARTRLEASGRDTKLLLFFTDGAPTDLSSPDEGRALLGEQAFDTFVLGLYGSADVRDTAEAYLRPLAKAPDDLVLLDDPSALVPAFTRGYARALGSRPVSGTLAPGGSHEIPVGRYVSEVMVFAASEAQGPAFQAELVGPAGAVKPQASGDDGCPPGVALRNAPKVCADPRRHYQVFRARNDPDRESTWRLSLPAGPAVRWGVILVYDLRASLAVPTPVRVGEPVEIEARLLSRGGTFDDPAFFAADGFEATAEIEGQTVPLAHQGGGRFTGAWTPASPGAATATVTFRNAWMEKRDRRAVAVEGFLDLALVVDPVDLGAWRGGRQATRSCAVVDLSRSTNADRVPVTCAPSTGEGWIASCLPVPGSEATLGQLRGRPLQWEVCVEAEACCGDLPEGEPTVTFAGAHPHYASGAVAVPVRFRVTPTGLLRCWWLELATFAAGLGVAWVTVGWVRPHGFDASATLRLAAKESDLGGRRASTLVLQEQPGGKRGFYRNARLCVDGEGNAVRTPARAVLVVEAGPRGATRIVKGAGLERQDRRTRKWEAVPQSEWPLGYTAGVVYRVGSLYLKFG